VSTEPTTGADAGPRPGRDGSATFAAASLVLAAIAFVVAIAGGLGAFDGDTDATQSAGGDGGGFEQDDGAVADPGADVAQIVESAAAAMGEVTSVEFRLQRDGAPVFIDEFERIALDSLRGQFTVPTRAQAELSVTVNDNLATRLGAVAVDSEVWISNPVTGDFETLPAGYDIDPSKFFDPKNGWQPLLANLQQVALTGVDDRGGDRYRIEGTAPAAQVSEITVGLVEGQDVGVALWVHPSTFLVTAAEFETVIDGERSQWVLELGRYGDEFVIEPPENVRAT
jgi:hypothetical protein